MACQGVGRPSNDRIDALTQDVLTYLKDKHKLLTHEPSELWWESRQQVVQGLRSTLAEILFQDDCEGF